MRSKIIIMLLTAFAALVSIAGASGAAASQPGPSVGTPVTSPALAAWHAVPGHEQQRVIRLEPGPYYQRAWSCPRGYSCYYDGRNGSGARWIAPSCGWHNLGTMYPRFNDRISSIWNRGGGAVDLYNWDGRSRWIYLGTVAVGARGNLPYRIDNIVDAVNIHC